MAGAGHLSYFLYLYRNFYRFCNQGFEANNNKFRLTFLKCSNKGGYRKGQAAEDRSKIREAARPLYRRIFWWSGEGERFFTFREDNPTADLTDSTEVSNEDYEEISEIINAIEGERGVMLV